VTQPGSPLDEARDRVVLQLSSLFAHDRLTMEELDRRLELAYTAESMPQLEKLVADLGALPPVPAEGSGSPAAAWGAGQQLSAHHPSAVATRAQRRILAIMSETRRRGEWIVPARLDIVAVMSSLLIDLRDATLTADETVLDLAVMMAQVTVVIPRGMRVIDDATAIMADHKVEEHASSRDLDAPVLRLTGWSAMAEVKVRD
jgi:hypothetical protein